jgi:hypothetical protein
MNKLEIAATVDALGLLQVEKAALAKREKDLKAKLGKPGDYAGNLFDVNVAACDGKATLSMAKARMYLTEALLAKVTTMGASSLRFSVKAKSAEKVAA